LRKMTRGRRSERTTRDVSSGDDDCSDDSNGDSDADANSGDGDSGDADSNSDSGGSDSKSGGKNNNQLKPAAEKAATAVNAALASILLAS
jgi:dihydrofolate synthase/folylpolyglutamate synthase